MDKVVTNSRKVLIGILGGLVALIGLILVPYPGPGWLIVFGGLAILGTEFVFAARLLTWAKGKYEAWMAWFKRQPWYVKIVALLGTAAAVLVSLWLLNALALVASVLGYEYAWLVSPFFRVDG